MNRKGQALVEFVLILPIFLMILFVIVDFGTIFSSKSKLENDSASIVDMYKNGDSLEEIRDNYKDIDIAVSKYKDKYIKFVITSDVKLITPGLNRVLDNPFEIKIERIINAT